MEKKERKVITRRALGAVLVVGAAVAFSVGVIVFPMWTSAIDRARRQQSAEPFRIVGNLYYVGGSDVTSFLLTGPEGHVLIDGGYAATASVTIASIATLGFDIKDVKVLLNSEPLFDHAGGLSALQEASGGELWASEASAATLAAGGDNRDLFLPMRAFIWAGINGYPAPRIDHRFKDGARIPLGPIELTAHITGGHSPGCTSWSFPVRDGDRELQVVRVCTLTRLPGTSLVEPQRYPGIRADFERTFRVLRSLPVDIFLTGHAREFGRYRKFLERDTAKNPVDPFIDREGYLRYIDNAEDTFRQELAEQQQSFWRRFR